MYLKIRLLKIIIVDKKYLIILITFISLTGYSQRSGPSDSSLFSFNYTLAPISNDGVDFRKTDINFNIPIKLKKGMLFNSIGFNYIHLGYDDISFSTKNLEQFYNINYGLTYIYPLNDKWIITTRAGISIASNLSNSITSEDLLFNGGIVAVKRGGTREKPSRFAFGLGYATITGKPRVIPLISYVKQVNENFSFGIGFPNTFAKYVFNEKHSLKTILWMNGFYSNLSDPVSVDGSNEANKASFRALSGGLEYNYWMNHNKTIAIVLKGGYSFSNSYELLDENNNTVHDFNLGAKPYFSAGFKFSLKNKFKNKKQKTNEVQ